MTAQTRRRVTAVEISARKASRGKGARLVMVTAYDATFTRLIENADVDILLVGDSVGMVVQGHENTLPVTLEHMVYHSAAVARASKVAHVVTDLPFMSYQVSPQQAVASAGRLVQEGGAHSVKLEGGRSVAPAVQAIVDAGIPVMGHLGLTPQSVHRMGGFKVQGRGANAAAELLDDALALQEAGAYAIVLEGIPKNLAEQITQALEIPTIGIGAGVHCDGQVLVCYDLLGLDPGFRPKFVRAFAELHGAVSDAVQGFAQAVRDQSFPTDAHSFESRTLRVAHEETLPPSKTKVHHH